METATFILVRAITYSTLFIGFLLVFLPGRVLTWAGIVRPATIGVAQAAGVIVAAGGAVLALAGAALFYGSWALLGYCAAFGLVMYLFVVVYEEPILRATFGGPYVRHCERVHRWWPRRSAG